MRTPKINSTSYTLKITTIFNLLRVISVSGKKTTTTTSTTPAPIPPPPDYTALYVILALVASFSFFFWCCWRPGYIPWRFGRMRNVPFFHACGKCIPCCIHTSPCCEFLGGYPCCRCCAEGNAYFEGLKKNSLKSKKDFKIALSIL